MRSYLAGKGARLLVKLLTLDVGRDHPMVRQFRPGDEERLIHVLHSLTAVLTRM
jgi:hypothetical protein